MGIALRHLQGWRMAPIPHKPFHERAGQMKSNLIRAAIVCLLFAPAPAHAQTLDEQKKLKEKNEQYYKQYDALPLEQTVALSAKILGLAEPNQYAATQVVVLLALGSLGYGISPSEAGVNALLREYVIQFQRDLGEAQTGIITTGQAGKLMQRAHALKSSRVLLSGGESQGSAPKVYTSAAHPPGELVRAEGAWGTNDGEQSSTIETVRFECRRSLMLCFRARATINVADPTTYFMNLRTDVISVESWTAVEVRLEEDYGCHHSTTTINVRDKEVLEIVRNGGTDTQCEGLPSLTPKMYRMTGAFKRSNDFFEQQQRASAKHMSSHFLAGLAKVLGGRPGKQ